MTPREHALDNLAHAEWRANFFKHLIEAHLRSPWKGTDAWKEYHAELLQSLAAAEDEVTLRAAAPPVLSRIIDGAGIEPGKLGHTGGPGEADAPERSSTARRESQSHHA